MKEEDVKRTKEIIWELRVRPIYGHFSRKRNGEIFKLLKELEDIVNDEI